MGGRGGGSGLRGAGGGGVPVAQQPEITDINQWGDLNRNRISSFDDRVPGAAGSTREAVQWFGDHMGMTPAKAKEAADMFLYFTYHGDYEMHRNIGKGVHGNDVLDKVVGAPNAPVYTGQQYRGLVISRAGLKKYIGIDVNPRDYINSVIKSGVWRETGGTSFTTSSSTANLFGSDVGYGDVKVVVSYKGKTGFPIRHLSHYPGENEVFHSRAQMTKGYRIANSTWSGDTVYIDIKD